MIDSTPESTARFPKLNETNYATWAMQMEAVLIRAGLWTDMVEILTDVTSDGVKRPQEEIDAEIDQKMEARSATKMAEARALLILNVEPSQLVHMRDRDPLAVWQDLQAVHRARGFATVLSLRRKFYTMKKTTTKKMAAWIGDVKAQAFEMEAAGVDLTDLDIILAITMGLPSSYDSLIISLDDTPADQLTLDYVIGRLLNEETRQLSRPSRAAAEDAASPVLVARSVDAERVTCHFCNKKGHYKSDCPERMAWEVAKAMKVQQEANLAAEDVDDDDYAY